MARESFKPTPRDREKTQNLETDGFPDVVSVDLDDKDPNNFAVLEVDDTPEADRGKPTRVEDLAETKDPSNYQKRIDRIKAETNTERRGREQAERERDAAIEAARVKDAEVADLRRRLEGSNTTLAASMKGEREARLADAQRRYTQANTDGDAAAMTKAMTDIAGAQAELVQIAARAPAPRPAGQPQQVQQPQRQAAPAAAPISPDAAAWVGYNNSWWGKDKAKTETALAINRSILSRGVRDNSPEYTRELDKALKAVYPDHQPFDRGDADSPAGGSTPRRTNVVADGGRENPNAARNPRTVELTSSQLAIAKQLNLTPQQYAASLVKYNASRSAQK